MPFIDSQVELYCHMNDLLQVRKRWAAKFRRNAAPKLIKFMRHFMVSFNLVGYFVNYY